MSEIAFVTGGTGLVGNNVIRELISQRFRVRALIRTTSDQRPLAGLDVEIVEGDVREPAAVRRGCQGADVVIHAAAMVHIGWSRPTKMQAVNVTGTANVARATREAGARLVHISTVNSLAVVDRHEIADEDTAWTGREILSQYVATKRGADQVVRAEQAQGLNAVCLYPGLMFGPWDWKPSSGQMLRAVARQFTPMCPVEASQLATSAMWRRPSSRLAKEPVPAVASSWRARTSPILISGAGWQKQRAVAHHWGRLAGPCAARSGLWAMCGRVSLGVRATLIRQLSKCQHSIITIPVSVPGQSWIMTFANWT